MTKVRLRFGMVGPDKRWVKPGSVVEVDAKTAKALIESSQADAVNGQVETATAGPEETGSPAGKKKGKAAKPPEE